MPRRTLIRSLFCPPLAGWPEQQIRDIIHVGLCPPLAGVATRQRVAGGGFQPRNAVRFERGHVVAPRTALGTCPRSCPAILSSGGRSGPSGRGGRPRGHSAAEFQHRCADRVHRWRGWISTPQFCAREFNPFRAWGVEVRVVPGLRPGFKLDPVPGSPEARSRRLRIAFEGAAGVQIDAAPGLAPGLNWGIASRISHDSGVGRWLPIL